MENVLLTILLINALLLIGIVLLQRSEGGGLGMGGGGGGAMSGRSAASAMAKLTWLFGIAFFACSIALTIVAAKNSAGASVVDRLGAQPAPVETPALPTGSDLLPPPAGDAPATPPRVD
jgi:preprotein translocase subunit SecG